MVNYILILSYYKNKVDWRHNRLGIENYSKLRNTTDIVILTTENRENQNERKVPTKGLQILLIKRDSEPFNGKWTLPGGFVDSEKSLKSCVEEKLKQKTGISTLYKEQLYTYGDDVYRDPRDRVITIAYIALTSKDKTHIENCHGDKETDWFWVNTTRNIRGEVIGVSFTRNNQTELVDELGFDHNNIVIDAINRISNKIMYTDIGFHLVEDEFTIKELQMAYEAVTEREISGFRRIIEDKIVETGKITTDVRDKPDAHRPAKLYRMIRG